jgi:hypothetical protein
MSVWPRSSRMSTWRSAEATIASGVWPSFSSRSRASEPMLTPMRIGVPMRSAAVDDFARLLRIGDVAGIEAQLGDARLRARRAPSCDRSECRRRSARASARRCAACRRRRGRPLTGDAHDLAAGHRQAVDLLERLVDVGRVGRRHRLHDDRMIAADPDLLGVLRPLDLFSSKTGLDLRRKRIMGNYPSP